MGRSRVAGWRGEREGYTSLWGGCGVVGKSSWRAAHHYIAPSWLVRRREFLSRRGLVRGRISARLTASE